MSGFRDASALAWRLQVACRPGFVNYEPLFRGWYSERKQQLEKSLAATVENGEYVAETNPVRIIVRDTWLWMIQLVPSWNRWLEQGARRDGMLRYKYEPAMTFLPSLGGGGCFPQAYCVQVEEELVAKAHSIVTFTDDVIFSEKKSGLFQLVLLPDTINETLALLRAVFETAQPPGNLLLLSEATVIVQDTSATGQIVGQEPNTDVVRIATAEEFAASKLCTGRPAPQYYNEYCIRREMGGRKFVILRPDMFVFAACHDTNELAQALAQIPSCLEGMLTS